MKWLHFLVLLVGINLAQARPAQIIIIRHGEEPGGTAVHLSSRGRQRADALAFAFSTNATILRYGLPVALFAPRPSVNGSLRSWETLKPTSRRLHVPVQGTYSQTQYTPLAMMLLDEDTYEGKTVVIAWTHSFIPQMVAALGVRPTPPAIKSTVYDRYYVITYTNNAVVFQDLPERLLKGDSKR